MEISRATSRQQLRGEGHDRAYGDRRVAAGSWTRAAPSVYLQPAAPLADRLEAALLHAGRDGVVTGWAACTLLRLPYVVDGGAVDVLVPAGRRRVSTPWVHVLPTTRPPLWLPGPYGVRVASPARAVIDAARSLPDLRSVRALVLGAGSYLPVEELRVELDATAKARTAVVRRALRDLAVGALSAPEAELADLAAEAAAAGRLPGFLLNPALSVGDTSLGWPDGWLPGLGLGWEMDSREFHDGDLFESTLERSDRYVAHGLVLLHITPARLRRSGERTTDLLVAAVAARRASGAVEPPGLVVVPRGPLLPLRHRPR